MNGAEVAARIVAEVVGDKGADKATTHELDLLLRLAQCAHQLFVWSRSDSPEDEFFTALHAELGRVATGESK